MLRYVDVDLYALASVCVRVVVLYRFTLVLNVICTNNVMYDKQMRASAKPNCVVQIRTFIWLTAAVFAVLIILFDGYCEWQPLGIEP